MIRNMFFLLFLLLRPLCSSSFVPTNGIRWGHQIITKEFPGRLQSMVNPLDDGKSLSGAWTLGLDTEGEQKITMVTLTPGGSFSTPKGSDTEMKGTWSVDLKTREVTVAVHGIARTVKLWFVGTLNDEGAEVKGFVGMGSIDPEWIGNFTLSKFMPNLEGEKYENIYKKPTPPMFHHADLVGSWTIKTRRNSKLGPEAVPLDSLETASTTSNNPKVQVDVKHCVYDASSGRFRVISEGEKREAKLRTSSMDVILYENSTWETVSGLGQSAKLAGRWNVFADEIDLGTGIKGSGSRFWMVAKRFGTLGGQVSRGVQMTSDILYVGSISYFLPDSSGSSADTPEGTFTPLVNDSKQSSSSERSPSSELFDGIPGLTLRISGFLANGFGNEPVFVGQFNMTRPYVHE